MPSLSLLQTFFREVITRERSKRVTEPNLVMDDPDKVAAYTRAGREDGVMAPVYLFHCAQICQVVKPGDTVVDLGCGPATQLAMVARLNPDATVIGIDLSDEMLHRARDYVGGQSLRNVEFQAGDISNLAMFPDASVDALYSTVALHHLPDFATLEKTFSEISRVLKPGGGLYVVDFGHLKSEKSIAYFAHQYAGQQPELFTLDYLYSLRAAFSRDDFVALSKKYFADRMAVKSTFLMPYMVAVKSPPRADLNNSLLKGELKNLYNRMPGYHKKDLSDLKMFFRLGGLQSQYLSHL
jgi:ubiquinone/menaquinone biosynthesis C-methylase UbiE